MESLCVRPPQHTLASGSEPVGSPSDPVTPPDGDRWDLLVVGGGTAGLVAAKTAAGFGASVLLVERGRTGGDCLWTGCVPSKALLTAAHAAASARSAHRLGVFASPVVVDFAAVMRHVHGAIATIAPTDSPAALRDAGVRVAHGHAAFTARDVATVDGVEVRFRQALLAAGSAPMLPSISGLAAAEPLTSDTVWSLPALPERLLVLGAGSIGCELAQAFSRLGSLVTVVETSRRALFREDEDAADLVAEALVRDGVTLRFDASLMSVRRDGRGWQADLADGTRIGFDRVLVATGRRADVADLGLDAAGVALDRQGNVWVDPRLRTTNARIWAAGDVTAHPRFTHVAGVHGSLAAGNAVLGLRRTVQPAIIPRVTYTQPEVAAVGVGLEDAARDPRLVVRTVPHSEVDRAIAAGDVDGFTRLVLDPRGHVVGATIVGPRAGESLTEVALATRHALRARDIAGSMHAYPTYSDGVWQGAIEQVQHQLAGSAARRATALLVDLRRRWVSR